MNNLHNKSYAYKYNKYLYKCREVVGAGVKNGTYTETCSNNNNGNKLNRIGLDKYLNYKKGSCDDLGWDINSCNLTNDLEVIKGLADDYKKCARDREGFSEMCVISIDANHQHAIDRMEKYGEECELKLNNNNNKNKNN